MGSEICIRDRDKEFSTEIGTTKNCEKVRVANEFAEADLMVYANVNYVAMDGGYKSYATGMEHYVTLKYKQDSVPYTQLTLPPIDHVNPLVLGLDVLPQHALRLSL